MHALILLRQLFLILTHQLCISCAKRVQDQVEASNVAKVVHEIDKLGGDADILPREAIVLAMTTLSRNRVLRTVVSIVIIDTPAALCANIEHAAILQSAAATLGVLREREDFIKQLILLPSLLLVTSLVIVACCSSRIILQVRVVLMKPLSVCIFE